MILNVRVIPRSSRLRVEQEGNSLKVHLTKPAYDGMANRQLIELLAEYLKVKKYRITIIRGDKSKEKTVRIDE